MSYFEFPHTRSYDGDLGYIIKRLEELTAKYGEFMEYNQIKFADPLEWDIAAVYTAWLIVFDSRSHGYYLSKKPVPAGVDIGNTDYWELIVPFEIDTTIDPESYNPVSNHAVAQRFSSVQSSISNVSTLLHNEGIARENADNALDLRIAANADNIETLSGRLTHETTTRETADTNLEREIDTLTTRVDNIAQTIVPGGTSGDAELADIRIGANGITYANAGDAVRGQYTENHTDIGYIVDAVGNNMYKIKSIPHTSTINETLSKIPLAVSSGTKITIQVDDPDNTSSSYSAYVKYSGAASTTTLRDGCSFGTPYTFTMANDTTQFSLYKNNLNSGTATFKITIHNDVSGTLTYKVNELESFKASADAELTNDYESLLANSNNTGSKLYATFSRPHGTGLNQANSQTDITIPKNYIVTISFSDANVTGNGTAYIKYKDQDRITLVDSVNMNNGSYTFITTAETEYISLYKASNVTSGTMTIKYEYGYNTAIIGVPAYYVDHMISKTATILDNMMAAGKNGETFIFITDIHWENNTKNSPALVRYLLDNLNINFMLCGGDLINEGLKVPMAKTMVECIKAFDFKNIFMPCVFGNHDSNKNDSNISHPERWFDASAQYALMQKQAEDKIEYFTDSGWNFTFKSETSKTLWVCVDTTENGTFTYYNELASVLNNAPAGYNIIIVGHWFYDSGNKSTFALNLEDIVDAYNDKTTAEIGGVNYDFTNAAASICGVIGGHMHSDMDWTTGDGIPFILSDSDNGPRSGNTDYPYVKGTITEQSFDVVTFDYTNRTIKCVRIGRGEDRDFTY